VLLETDAGSGWYKIEFNDEISQPGITPTMKVGWISNQYAKRVNTTISTTPTPAPKISTSSALLTPTKIPTVTP
jgi:hypothetical protein